MTASGQLQTKMVAPNLFRCTLQSGLKRKKGLLTGQKRKEIDGSVLVSKVPLGDIGHAVRGASHVWNLSGPMSSFSSAHNSMLVSLHCGNISCRELS